MKVSILIVVVLMVSSCNRGEEPTTTRGNLFMLVSNPYLPLMSQEADEFMAEYDKTHIRMEGTTAREAVVALLNDSVRCICIGRPMNAEERRVAQDAGITVGTIRIGRDALVFIVSDGNPVKTIKLSTLKLILGKPGARWKNVPGSSLSGNIEVIFTGKNSGTYELLQRKFFDLGKEIAPTKTGPTEKEIVQYIRANPQALGIVSFASVVDHPNGVHMLAVESMDTTSQKTFVEPNQSNIYEELYPFTYSLYLYLSEKKLGVGSGFGTFVMTLMGQKIIQEYGIAPETIPSRIIQLKSE